MKKIVKVSAPVEIKDKHPKKKIAPSQAKSTNAAAARKGKDVPAPLQPKTKSKLSNSKVKIYRAVNKFKKGTRSPQS